MKFNELFVTVFYSGFAKKAPGTVGSFVSLILGYLILMYLSLETLVSATVALGIIGVFEINKYQKRTGKQDPKEVVIDELVGMWIALSMVPFGIVEALLAFVMFRAFDITKPSIIGRIDEKMKNGLGVMLDDVLAGIFGGIASLLILRGLNFLGLY